MATTQPCFKGLNINPTLSTAMTFLIILLLGTNAFAEDATATESTMAPTSVTTASKAKPTERRSGSVIRAVFTSQIVDREPVDTLDAISRDIQQVFFFTDLRHLQDQIITHRWEHNGQVMAEVKFKVGGPRWRVYSSKNLLPGWVGSWTVVVTDESGKLLNSSSFEYGAAASAGASPAQ